MGIVAVNFWLGERAQSDFDEAISARDTRIAAVESRNAMLTAEASQRGFLLTGNEIYLAPYQPAKIQARRHLSALQALLLRVGRSSSRNVRLFLRNSGEHNTDS